MKSPGLYGRVILAVLLLLSFASHGQVWLEDFADEGNLDVSGTAIGGTWTTITPTGGAVSFSRRDVGVPYGPIFMVNNTNTEGVWQSNVIDISLLGEVALEVTVGGNDATAGDYVRAYYRIDGGAETLFGQATGSPGLSVFTAASAIVSGSTLQIVIRGMDNSPGGFPNTMGFDNVRVTDISVLYSIANTAWNNGNTWSTVGFGGGACGCTPGTDTRVIIGNNHTVDFTANGSTAGLEIQNTGTLQWTADNLALSMQRGGTIDIQAGGVLTRGTRTGSSIVFNNYTYTTTVAGTVIIGVVNYTGSGGSTITNSGTFTTATANGLFITGGNGYTIANSGTMNLTDMDLNTADITINNSGTINQTGNFTDVDAGSTFNNLSGGTWNFGGTTITNVRLFADNNSNTFNYNRAGAQNIITPQNAYSNLSLSGSGAKTALANFSVRGNWSRSGTATFAPGAFRVSLTGTLAQTISASGGETFANLTINNSFATSPQITLNNNVTVSTNLTMTAGNVDLNGNTFTISSNAGTSLTHAMTSAGGWMYWGNLTRAIPATAIAIGNVAGFFPMGNDTYYRPFLVGKNALAGSNGTITIFYNNANTASNVSFLDGAATIQRRHNAYWRLSKTGITAGTFDIRAGGAGFEIGNVSHTRLTRLSDAVGIGTAGGSTGSPADVRANRTGLTFAQIVNDFYMASTDGVASPLPIELAYFRAKADLDGVIATWKTVQEKNNHFFTLQKTVDFETFYEIGRIEGKGNSVEEHTYELYDDSPFRGRSYYRLKQTDFDGAFTYSDPVMIDYQGASSLSLKAFPNPFSGKRITVQLQGLDSSPSVPLIIYNQQGQKVMEIMLQEEGAGIFRKEIIFPQDLSPGLYYLKAGRSLKLRARVAVDPSVSDPE